MEADREKPFVEEVCLPFLRNAQNRDGGWGFHPQSESRVEPTCWALQALSESSNREAEVERRPWIAIPSRGSAWRRFVALDARREIRLLGDFARLLGLAHCGGFVRRGDRGHQLALPGLAEGHHAVAAISGEVFHAEGAAPGKQVLPRVGLDPRNQQLGRANFLRPHQSGTSLPRPTPSGSESAPRAGDSHALRPHVSRRRLELRQPEGLRGRWGTAGHSDGLGSYRVAS